MIDSDMLEPAFAMAGLTFAVWVRLYVVRIGEMKRRRIHPQALSSAAKVAERLEDCRASDNFRNLFELPVLFYLAILVAILGGLVTPVSLGLAWTFVGLRIVHSAVHCTYNKVMHRFLAYVSGGVVLALLWLYLALYFPW